MVSYFKKQIKANESFNVRGLANTEVNENYPLNRIYKETVSWNKSIDGQKLYINLKHVAHPDFKRKFVDGYKLIAIGIFLDFDTDLAESLACESDVIPLVAVCKPLSFEFHLPEKASQFLLCLRIEGYEKGQLCAGHTTKGMNIVAAGQLA